MIKLVMMVRDEAPGIEATLRSALPYIDSWLILDTGSTDGTQDIIRGVLADPCEKPGDLIQEPGPTYGATGLFDYAAARNRLLDLAAEDDGIPCRWLLMLDGDDELRHAEGLRAWLEAQPPDGEPARLVRITGQPGGDVFDSFRLIRSDCTLRYELPAHEILVGVKDNPGRVPDVEIYHAPGPTERLQRSLGNQATLLKAYLASLAPEQIAEAPWRRARATFYLGQALAGCQKFEEACDRYLERAAQGGWAEEVYESLRRAGNCCVAAKRPWATAQQYYLAAYTARPVRVEALLCVASHYLAANNMPLAYLFSHPPTGTDADDLLCVDLAARSKLAECHSIAGYFLGLDAKRPAPGIPRRLRFSLIHATRGRAEAAAGVWERWKSAASGLHEVEYIVSLDEDDEASRAITWPQHTVIAVGPDGGGSVAAYNRGLWCASGDVVVQVMDDVLPPPHWDALIAARIGDPTSPRLLHVSDGTKLHKDRAIPLLTVLIGTMALFKRAGYMYHPDYLHCFGDDDWSEKGHAEGIVEEATDIVFRHAWEGPDHDAAARRNYGRESFNHGAEALRKRRAAGFPDEPHLWPQFKVLDEKGAEVGTYQTRDELQAALAAM